ncbi:MAG: NADPH-dependent F420 reductase [Candidatus Hodarchaeales archaeon]
MYFTQFVTPMKKISIIGIGNVGRGLGEIWLEKGHEIRYGLRNEQNLAFLKLKEKYPFKVHGRQVTEVSDYSNILVLAVPYSNIEEIISQLGDLSNKIIIDCTNPVQPNLAGLSVGLSTSAAEEIARLAPKAHVVKAFNSIGMGNLNNLVFNGITADAFLCGDDERSKSVVGELAKDLGFNVVDVGPLTQARYLEPLGMLWISMAYQQGYGQEIAFKLLTK